jgi:hypothetical protein
MGDKKEKQPRHPFLEVNGFACYADSMSYTLNHPNGRTTYYNSIENMFKSLDAAILRDKLRNPSNETSVSALVDTIRKHNAEMQEILGGLKV